MSMNAHRFGWRLWYAPDAIMSAIAASRPAYRRTHELTAGWNEADCIPLPSTVRDYPAIGPHTSGDPRCHCGWRVVDHIEDLLNYTRIPMAVMPQCWVVGQAQLSGSVLRSAAHHLDPPGTWRGERLRITGRAYVSDQWINPDRTARRMTQLGAADVEVVHGNVADVLHDRLTSGDIPPRWTPTPRSRGAPGQGVDLLGGSGE